MKMILAIFLGLSSTFAFASNPRIFIGKYMVEHENNCSIDVGSRAYVSIKSYNGEPELQIDFYSGEAVIMSAPLKSGKRVDEMRSGTYTRVTTVVWPSKTEMKTKTISTGNNDGRRTKHVQEYSVSLKGKQLVFIDVQNGREQEYCVLTKK